MEHQKSLFIYGLSVIICRQVKSSDEAVILCKTSIGCLKLEINELATTKVRYNKNKWRKEYEAIKQIVFAVDTSGMDSFVNILKVVKVQVVLQSFYTCDNLEKKITLKMSNIQYGFQLNQTRYFISKETRGKKVIICYYLQYFIVNCIFQLNVQQLNLKILYLYK